jgi:hypothetical protein
MTLLRSTLAQIFMGVVTPAPPLQSRKRDEDRSRTENNGGDPGYLRGEGASVKWHTSLLMPVARAA